MSRDLYLYNDNLFAVTNSFTYSGHPEEFTLQPGTYLMVCYGARGGYSDSFANEHGMPLGGMSAGVITFDESTTLYAVVGGDGQTGNKNNQFTPGGYNGGGRGGKSIDPTQYFSGPSGGGSSDIRLNITPESIMTTTVDIPNDYTVLDQLCSKYNTYFDTGYIPKASTTLHIDFEYLPANWNGWQKIFGLYNDTIPSPYRMFYSFGLRANHGDRYHAMLPGGYEYEYCVGSIMYGRVIYDFTETEITWHAYNDNTIYHSESYNVGCTGFDFEQTSYMIPTLTIFGQQATSNNVTTVYNDPCPGILHSFTITEDGTDVHKYIPVIRNSDDVTGFYDVCTNTFTAYDGDFSPNILPKTNDADVTIDGVTISSEDGCYSIHGTSSNFISYQLPLLESVYVPEVGYYDDKNGYSLAFLNPTSIPSTVTISFGYYDPLTTTFTAYQTYNSGYSSYENDYNPSGLRHQTINCIEFEIDNGVTLDIELSPMLVKRPLSTIRTYYEPGKQLAQSSSISVNTKQMDSLMSRIIVAGGGGGGWRNDESSRVSSNNNIAGGGGAFGGTTHDGYNMLLYPTQTNGSYFGRGQNGLRKTGTTASSGAAEGDGGGGGGWYGGYTGITYSQSENSVSCGGGGSGYVLTATSYKPIGYIPTSKYYFQHIFMNSNCSKQAKVLVCKRITSLKDGDIIHVFFTGNYEKLTLSAGDYRITCDGPSGGNRWLMNTTKIAYGGRVSGTLSLDEMTTLYAAVGGCPTYAFIYPNTISNIYNTRFGNTTFNGGVYENTSTYLSQSMASGGSTDLRLLKPEEVTEILSIPDGYTELEYLESEGGPYIDIDYIHKADTRIECNCYISSTPTGIGYLGIYGAREGPTTYTHVFFAQFANSWNPCYGCNSGEYQYTGSTFPTDQIVTVITEGANASWYDENGDLIDGWTNTSGGQVNGNRVMRLFGLNNNNSYDGATMVGKMYSFKVYESTTIKCYLLPCKRNSDNVLGMYDIIRQTFYAETYYNRDFIAGPSIPDEDKTTYEYTYVDIERSLLSRIIVAGGAGGSGGYGGNNDNIRAGGGGGSEGGNVTVGYGDNAGPGTQTGSPTNVFPETNGGFGYGGCGAIVNGAYGGSGGGGWYGGCGTMPDQYNTGDDDKYGTGGSGYVLTATSYKPTGYIPTSKYYMSEPVSIQSGNTDIFGAITIEASNVTTFKLLILDDEGVKTYDADNSTWTLIPGVESITLEIIDQYGVSTINDENGIIGEYDIYCIDEDDIIVGITYNVIPDTIHVVTYIDTPNYIADASLDCENFDENIEYSINSSPYQSQQRVDISFDLEDVSSYEYQVYSITITSTRTENYIPPIEHEKTYKIPTDLLTVGEYNRIPNKYNDYIPQTLLDGTTITKIGYVNTKIRNRIVYTLMSLNDTHIRLSSFNLLTKSINVIFETQLSVLEMNYTSDTYNQVGDFLIDDENVYITTYRYRTFIWKIPLNSIVVPTDISSKTKITTTNEIGGGRLCWYNEEVFIYHTYADKHINFYNTRLQEVVRQITAPYGVFGEIICSGNYLIARLNQDSFYSFNLTDDTYLAFSGKDTVVCADNTRIFVVTYVSGGSDTISIYSNEDLSLLGTITIPVSDKIPTSVYVSNNILYITFKDMMNVYICELKSNDTYDTYKTFVTMPLQFTLNDFRPINDDVTVNTILGTTFKQYFFLPYYRLFVTNYQATVKYNMGYVYNRLSYPTNNEHEQSFTYDPSFITFEESYMSIHDGSIDYDAASYDVGIKSIHIERDYKKMISSEIRREE